MSASARLLQINVLLRRIACRHCCRPHTIVVSCNASKGVMKTSIVKMAAVLLVPAVLSGCGVLAAPCRIGSAVIKMVPVVGHAAALPTDACAAVIDP